MRDTRLGERAISVAIAAATIALATRADAQTCDPFELKFEITQAPDPFREGNIYFQLQSRCEADTSKSRVCAGVAFIPELTSRQIKCGKLVEQIRANCGTIAGWELRSDPLDDQCSTLALFKVRNKLCPQGSSGGVTIGISTENGPHLSTPTPSGYLADYGLDVITPGCTEGGAGGALLKGVSNGVSISGAPNATVSGQIDLTNLGGPNIVQTVVVNNGDSPGIIMSRLRSALNVALAQTTTGVTCSLTGDVALKRVGIVCSKPSTTGVAAVGSPGFGVGIVVDEIGLTRAHLVGQKTTIDSFFALIDEPPSQTCPTFTSCNLVGAPATTKVPASGPLTLGTLVLLFGAGGTLLLRRRHQRSVR